MKLLYIKCKKYGKCLFGIFLTVLAVSVALKVIVIVLNILPGPDHGNVLIVVLAAVLVGVAAKYYSKSSCCFTKNKCGCCEDCTGEDGKCDCGCKDCKCCSEEAKECCDKPES